MNWLLPIFLWLTITILAAWRDIPRITFHLEHTYGITGQAARIRSGIIASFIYFPAFAVMVLGGWLSFRHQIGEFGLCTLWIIGPLWIFLGYTLTGGRSKV